MRVGLLTAGLLLMSAMQSNAAIVNMSAPPKSQTKVVSPPKVIAPAQAKTAAPTRAEAKVSCPCHCPKDLAVRQKAHAHAALRRMAHHIIRRYAGGGYYNYGAAAPVSAHEGQRQWRVAPNDGIIPGPMAYGPPHGYEPDGLQVDDRGWTGGVGTAADGGGGFTDGYGQVHFANGGTENGPTYNGYGQSFQFNPSQAGPFQPRLMGGFAPSNSGSR